MKKLSILFLLSSLLLSCEEIIYQTIESDSTIPYITITPSEYSGTTETIFTFTAETNDYITGWYADNQFLYDTQETATLIFSDIGDHQIDVFTTGGARDTVIITVDAVPEPEPVYTGTFYKIEGREVLVPDVFTVDEDYVYINGVGIPDEDLNSSVVGESLIVSVRVNVEFFDEYLACGVGLAQHFAMDKNHLTRDELIKFSEILNAYDGSNLDEVKAVFNG